jgi:3-hydroxybutyrate dehydrogenase
MTLSGKTALITGVASGSAAAIAHAKQTLVQRPIRSRHHRIAGLCRTLAKEGAPHGAGAHVISSGHVRARLIKRQMMLGTTADGESRTVKNAAWPGSGRMH